MQITLQKHFYVITGDWHCAYLLLYGPKILEVPEVDDKPEPMITEHDDEDPPIALA